MSIALAEACGGKGNTNTGPSPTPVETRTVSQFFTNATAVGETTVSANVQSGSAPAASGGPTATVTSVPQAADAGLGLLSIQGSAPFQTIYLSIGSAETARAITADNGVLALVRRSLQLFEAPLAAATIQTSGFLQISLPSAVTSASVVLNFSTSLPRTFEMRVQLAAPGGATGPAATLPKTLQTEGGPIEIVGVVLSTFGPNPANPLGPGLYGPPVAGATVSTSLDSRTATTNANGAFDLVTATPNALGRCFRLTITAAGYPTYSSDGWIGSNKESGGVRFTLNPPQPPDLGKCN